MAREGTFNLCPKIGSFRGNKQAVKGWEKRTAGFVCDNAEDVRRNKRNVRHLETVDSYWPHVSGDAAAIQNDRGTSIQQTQESTPVIEECSSSDELPVIEDDEKFGKFIQEPPLSIQQSPFIASFPCSDEKDDELVISQEDESDESRKQRRKTVKDSFLRRKRLSSAASQLSPEIEVLSCSSQSDAATVVIDQDDVSDERHSPLKKPDDPFNITCDHSPRDGVKKKKASSSDWLQAIARQAETTSKDEQSTALTHTLKRKRYARSGLAYRWQQLVAREHASMAIWRHELNSTKPQKADVLRIHLLTVQHDYTIYVATCKVLSGTVMSSEVKRKLCCEDFSQTLRSKVNQYSSTVKNEDQIVLFPSQRLQKWLPRVGSVVRIYAPWKVMAVSSSALLILASYFEEESHTPGLSNNEAVPQLRCVFKWQCKCVIGEAKTLSCASSVDSSI